MCFPSLFIQTVVEIYRSKSKAQKLFFAVFIYRVLNFLGLKDFPTLELVHIIDPIGATFLKQQQAQMKSAEPSIRTLKRPRGEAFSAALASSDQFVAEEVHVDPTIALDLAGDDDETTDPAITPPFSLRATMESFMTTQAAHRQLLDELITKLAALIANFSKYRSVFPPLAPSDP